MKDGGCTEQIITDICIFVFLHQAFITDVIEPSARPFGQAVFKKCLQID
jgi:hypothetical protein